MTREEIKKELLTKNAEHNDKVVDKVNWENMFLKDKLKKIEEYINFLVIFEPNIGRFNKTIWGEEILSIIKGDE